MYGGCEMTITSADNTKRGTYDATNGVISLDGSNDTYFFDFAPGTTDKFTFICKAALTDDTSYSRGIAAYWDGVTGYDWDVVGNAILLNYSIGTLGGAYRNNSVLSGGSSFSGTAFHTFMREFDGTNERLYLDGSVFGTPTASTGNFAASGKIIYGGRADGAYGTHPWHGKIGRCIAVAGGSILSSDERTAALTWVGASP
jgi:hypothetical protein